MTEQQEQQFEDVMLDLETLGKGPSAYIVSIGAVRYNLQGRDTFESLAANSSRLFYSPITTEEQFGDIDPDTVAWWMQQSDAARSVFKETEEHRSLSVALTQFNEFTGCRYLWGNGNMFDNNIIRSALKNIGIASAWRFWQDLDLRTLKRIALKKEPSIDLESFRKLGIYHNALNDAIVQVLMAQRCWRAINGELSVDERFN
jgi:hypothetical protein